MAVAGAFVRFVTNCRGAVEYRLRRVKTEIHGPTAYARARRDCNTNSHVNRKK